MCTEYNTEMKCEHKPKCELLGILKENRKLKQELKTVKKELEEKRIYESWEKNPERMGR